MQYIQKGVPLLGTQSPHPLGQKVHVEAGSWLLGLYYPAGQVFITWSQFPVDVFKKYPNIQVVHG